MGYSTDFLLGIGTGRCGSNTLTELLKINGISAEHEGEPKPNWDGSSDIDPHSLGECRIAHWWLNYIPKICEARETKIIVLKRRKEETVESYCAIKGVDLPEKDQLNHFRPSGTPLPEVDRTYPTYEEDISLEDGFGKYWQEYYTRVEDLILKGYPIRVFQTELLSEPETQQEILQFAGLQGKVIVYPGLKLWRREIVLEQFQRGVCARAYTR